MTDRRLLRDPTPEEIAEQMRIRDEIKAGWSEDERLRRAVHDGRVSVDMYRVYPTPDRAALRK